MARFSRAAAALAIAAALVGARPAEPLYLHVIPVEVRPGVRLDPERALRVAAYAPHPDRLAQVLGAGLVRDVRDDRVVIDLGEYPQLEAGVPADFTAASFVVDFDEAPVAALRRAAIERYGERPDIDALADFTHATIADKGLGRGWEVASRVATHRSGDCTEHAVLLTALVRALGRPARVVLGVVLLQQDELVGAFGHAWTEVHDGTRWRRVDATRIDREARALYIPQQVLRDEGPGYLLGILPQMDASWIRKLEVLGNAP